MNNYFVYLVLKNGTTKVVDSSAITKRQAEVDASIAFLSSPNAMEAHVREISPETMYQED